jgi:hypothetical protein
LCADIKRNNLIYNLDMFYVQNKINNIIEQKLCKKQLDELKRGETICPLCESFVLSFSKTLSRAGLHSILT